MESPFLTIKSIVPCILFSNFLFVSHLLPLGRGNLWRPQGHMRASSVITPCWHVDLPGLCSTVRCQWGAGHEGPPLWLGHTMSYTTSSSGCCPRERWLEYTSHCLFLLPLSFPHLTCWKGQTCCFFFLFNRGYISVWGPSLRAFYTMKDTG